MGSNFIRERARQYQMMQRIKARGARARSKGQPRFGSNPYNKESSNRLWSIFDSGWVERDQQLSKQEA